jgi:hypothetical protein
LVADRPCPIFHAFVSKLGGVAGIDPTPLLCNRSLWLQRKLLAAHRLLRSGQSSSVASISICSLSMRTRTKFRSSGLTVAAEAALSLGSIKQPINQPLLAINPPLALGLATHWQAIHQHIRRPHGAAQYSSRGPLRPQSASEMKFGSQPKQAPGAVLSALSMRSEETSVFARTSFFDQPARVMGPCKTWGRDGARAQAGSL